MVFKNNAPFINCISKINGVKTVNSEDLDVVMPMYNLLEYSKNYRKIIVYGIIVFFIIKIIVYGIIIEMNQIVVQIIIII